MVNRGQECLESCSCIASDESLPIDHDYLKFHDEFLGVDEYKLCTLSLRSQRLNIDRQVLQQKMWRMCMAQLAADRLRLSMPWSSLCSGTCSRALLSAKKGGALFYLGKR